MRRPIPFSQRFGFPKLPHRASEPIAIDLDSVAHSTAGRNDSSLSRFAAPAHRATLGPRRIPPRRPARTSPKRDERHLATFRRKTNHHERPV